MIKFAKERVNLICSQLKGWSVVQKVPLEHMQVKEGCFITPEEADAAPGEWKNFDMGRDNKNYYYFSAVDGNLDYYFIYREKRC